MALLNIYADLKRVAAALESIDTHLVELIRMTAPPEPAPRPRRRITADDIVDCTATELVRRQQEEALRESIGLPRATRDKLGRLLYPEDFPDGYPEDAAQGLQTIPDR